MTNEIPEEVKRWTAKRRQALVLEIQKLRKELGIQVAEAVKPVLELTAQVEALRVAITAPTADAVAVTDVPEVDIQDPEGSNSE